MSGYAKVPLSFWVRGQGKALRGDQEARDVLLYLMTAPDRRMTGLFSVNLPSAAHHLGLSVDTVRGALERLSVAGFALYDEEAEVVFLPDDAATQIGDSLPPRDNRIKSIEKELAEFVDHPFYDAFLSRYRERYHLECPPSRPPRTPWQAPCRPLGDPLASPLSTPSKVLGRSFEGPRKPVAVTASETATATGAETEPPCEPDPVPVTTRAHEHAYAHAGGSRSMDPDQDLLPAQAHAGNLDPLGADPMQDQIPAIAAAEPSQKPLPTETEIPARARPLPPPAATPSSPEDAPVGRQAPSAPSATAGPNSRPELADVGPAGPSRDSEHLREIPVDPKPPSPPAEPAPPLALTPPVPVDPKPAPRRPKKPPTPEEADALLLATLTRNERAIHDAITGDATLKRLCRGIAELSQDLAKIAPHVNVPSEVVALGAWCRAKPSRAPKSDGNMFLVRNLKTKEEEAVERGAPIWTAPEPKPPPREPPPCPPPHPLVQAGIDAQRARRAAGLPMPTLEETMQRLALVGGKRIEDPPIPQEIYDLQARINARKTASAS